MVKKVKKIKSVAIYTSKKSKYTEQILEQLIEINQNLGLVSLIPSSSALNAASKGKETPDSEIHKKADLVIAIGGDGALLSCSRKFGFEGLPVLGINLGNLGFLNDIAPVDLTNSLIQILEGNFIQDERFFLQAIVNKKENDDIALNEVVIHSGSIAQLIEYEVFIDSKFVYRQKADGLIINTPTGSTAYALSGNGPIIHPKVNAICLLPMFPHSLNTRPLLVEENVSVTIVPNKKSYLSYDSHKTTQVERGDEIVVKKALNKLNLVHPLTHDFYSACRTKLGWSLGVPNKISIDNN